jgi:hypothetical protein
VDGNDCSDKDDIYEEHNAKRREVMKQKRKYSGDDEN